MTTIKFDNKIKGVKDFKVGILASKFIQHYYKGVKFVKVGGENREVVLELFTYSDINTTTLIPIIIDDLDKTFGFKASIVS
jgi:hypothetical protein